MKRWRRKIGIILMVMLTITGCGGNGATTSPQQSTEIEALKIGLLRIDDSFPFYVAEKKGLFEKHGVKVEIISFGSGRDKNTALAAGELDGHMTDIIVAGLGKKGGDDTKIVAMSLGATAQEGRFLVVSAPNSGIDTPEDLQGHTIAISSNTMMDFLVESFEEIFQLDQEQITKVNIPDLMLRTTTLLEGRDIQAAILPDPLASFAVLEGANIVIDDTQLGVNLSQSVVTIAQEAIDNRRDDVEKLLAAYNEAIALINENPQEYKDFALECANVPVALAESYETPTFTANVVPDEDSVARAMQWLVDRGLIETKYSYEALVDNSFIGK